MNIIVTGKKQCGKSTTLLELTKLLNNSNITYGGVLTLGDAERKLVLLPEEQILNFQTTDINSSIKVGRFLIDKTNFKEAKTHLLNSTDKKIIIIDEIGILEKDKLGFYDVVNTVLKAENTITILAVRKDILSWFLEHFQSNSDFKVIRIEEKNSIKNATYIYSLIHDYL